MKNRKLIKRVLFYLLGVATVFFILYESGLTIKDISPQRIDALAHHHVSLIMLIMLIIMCLQNLFTFIPLILVITVNIALFGFWQGYLFSTACSVIGSTLIFLSIRYFFSNVFTGEKFKKYEAKIDQNGFLFVLSGRILPFMPTNLINILSGISHIKLSHFVLATTLGNLIYGFVLAAASFGILSATSNHLLLWLVVVVIIAVLVFRIWKKTKQPKAH